jgi:hypothetical protein
MKLDEVFVLLEWKEDLARGNVLLHYTDYEGLKRILETQTLKKRWYDFNHYAKSDRSITGIDHGYAYLKDGTKVKRAELMDEKSEIRKKQFGEIALARPSSNFVLKSKMSKKQELDKYEQLQQFSGKDYIAECILNIDNVKSGLRDVKHSKIAEYNIKWWKKLSFLFEKLNELFEEAHADWAIKKYDFESELINIKNVSTVQKEWDKEKTRIINYFFKYFKNDKYVIMSNIYKQIENSFANFKKSEINKEGEERITEDVPLKSKFIQIRLLDYIFELEKFQINELKTLIKENSEVFLLDSTYKKFMQSTS